MWEKKSADGGIHDVANVYHWGRDLFPGFGHGSGNIFDWVDELNNQVFAGHTDWRVPNVQELQSIVDYEGIGGSIAPAFNTGCIGGCTVLTCSCTALGVHWSSSTQALIPNLAWIVFFNNGGLENTNKVFNLSVRAVRGGL